MTPKIGLCALQNGPNIQTRDPKQEAREAIEEIRRVARDGVVVGGPSRPSESLNQEMKRVLDEHAVAAEKDKEYTPARQLMQEGIAKLKTPAPR